MNLTVYLTFNVRVSNGLGKCTWDQQKQSISSNQRNVYVDVSVHLFMHYVYVQNIWAQVS